MNKMSTKPYLLLDAGGTFLFVDQDYLSGLAAQHGFQVEARRFYEGHYHLVHWFDTYVSTHRRFLSRTSEPYSQLLFRLVGLSEEAAEQAAGIAEARHEQRNLWEFTFPWIVETLDRLRGEGYHMSIISNSDGRVEELSLQSKRQIAHQLLDAVHAYTLNSRSG